jgi:MFS family permease
MPLSAGSKKDPFISIRIPEFRNLMIGRFLFIMGLRMMTTVVGWWIYELTGDPFAIGLIGLSEVIPAVSIALYAGHVIDKSEKRKLLLRGIFSYFLCAAILVFLSTDFTEQNLNNRQISICIYAIIFFTGITRAFAGPVTNVLLAYIVPKENLANATTWSQGTWLSASVTGHAIGGFLIALIGITGTLITICILIAFSFAVFTVIKRRKSLSTGMVKTWESVKEGLRFVYKTKEVLGALTLDLFAVLFGGAVAMVPVYAKDILKVGAEGFGMLNAAVDIGAIFIVILLTVFPMQQKQGKKLFFAVAGFGICIIVFALSKSFLLSFVALLFAGMLDGISVVVRGTILQLKTPLELRGRVMSVNSMFINSSNELGQFESGLAAKMFGVIPSVVFGGGMTLLVVIITWFKAPGLRKLEY